MCGFLVTVHDYWAVFFHKPQRLKLFHDTNLSSLGTFKSSYEKYSVGKCSGYNGK